MRQIELFTVPSPCIGVCQSGPKGYCTGCFRSREERVNWLKIDDNTKKIINDACMRRKQSYARRIQAKIAAPTIDEQTNQSASGSQSELF